MTDDQHSPHAYRDSSGRTLADYPRPSVAVDVAVLTVPPGRDTGLAVLTIARESPHRHGQCQLPGTFLHPGETLTDAALRGLRAKTGIVGSAPRQLHVFDGPDRDERGWVLSVAHLDVVPYEQVEDRLDDHVRLQPVDGSAGLAFDHDAILAFATERVREDHLDRPDPFGLLPEPFTLLDLQRLHEAVAGRPLVKDTFRRRMEPRLDASGGLREGVVGKPARLWLRAPGGQV